MVQTPKLHKQLEKQSCDLNAELNGILKGRVEYGNISRSNSVANANTEDVVLDDDSPKFYTAYNGDRQHERGREHIYSSLNDDNDDDVSRTKHEISIS